MRCLSAEFDVSRPASCSGPVSCPADGSAALLFSMFGDRMVVERRGMATGERLLPQPVWRFDPATEAFKEFPMLAQPANVRQILGRSGEV